MTNRLRNWSQSSYGAHDGRSVSSLADENGAGSPSTTHVADASAQIPPAGFYGRDQARTTIKTPVRKRPLSQSR